MKARNVITILSLAAAACAAIAVGFHFNYSDESPEGAARAAGEPLAMATPEDTFGPDPSPDPGAPALPASDLEDTSMAVIEDSPATEAIENVAPRVVDATTLAAARTAITQRDVDTVLELLGESGPVEGAAFAVHYLRGLALRWDDRNEEALREMDAALTEQPDNVRALVNSVRSLLALDRAVEAGARAERALEITPQDADAWNVLGRAQLEQADIQAAIDAFQRATELDPAHAHAFNNCGYALIHKQEWQAAADALETAIDLRDDVAWFHNNLGVAYEQLDRPIEAAAAWRRALELQPSYDRVQVSLARIEPLVQAIEEQLAEAAAMSPDIEAKEQTDATAAEPAGLAPKIEGEETQRAGSDTLPRGDGADGKGTEAGSDSRSSQSGSGATEETPEGSISPH